MRKFIQFCLGILKKFRYLIDKIISTIEKNRYSKRSIENSNISIENLQVLFNSINDIKILLELHNLLYKKITTIATKLNKGIHPKHRIMNFHQFFTNNIDENSKILDIGCGRGFLTKDIAKEAKKVIGIDISKNKINFAREFSNRNNITYINGDATKFKFKEKFDYIVLSNVLEHIEERNIFLSKIKNLGKHFLIRVPMINRSWLSIYKKEIGLDYRLDKSHYIEYTLDTFKEEIESEGLKIVSYSIQFGEIWAKVEAK